MRVWKFHLNLGRTALGVPKGGRVVLFALQQSLYCLWIEIDPDAPDETRRFSIVGTGHRIPSPWKHLGSILDDAFVWPLYEETAEETSTVGWIT